MRFLPKPICEKLVKMGCETLSRHFWYGDNEYPLCVDNLYWNIDPKVSLVKSFTLEDFVSTDEYAKEKMEASASLLVARRLFPSTRRPMI